MFVRHRISSQTENSSDVKIAHVILAVISRLAVLISIFNFQFYYQLSTLNVIFNRQAIFQSFLVIVI
jgi:hypothetical protein